MQRGKGKCGSNDGFTAKPSQRLLTSRKPLSWGKKTDSILSKHTHVRFSHANAACGAGEQTTLMVFLGWSSSSSKSEASFS